MENNRIRSDSSYETGAAIRAASEQEKKPGRLPPELIRDVSRFMEEHYMPMPEEEITAETAVDRHREEFPQVSLDQEQIWKVSDLEEEDFQEERIEIREGRPVLSKDTASVPEGLREVVEQVGETFQQRLFRLIDERKLTDAEVYKQAHIDRKLFSKIRSNENYRPHKKTAIALALSLQLNLDETKDLLGRAGLALSPASRADLIVEYCIRHQIYDIDVVNELLDKFGSTETS